MEQTKGSIPIEDLKQKYQTKIPALLDECEDASLMDLICQLLAKSMAIKSENKQTKKHCKKSISHEKSGDKVVTKKQVCKLNSNLSSAGAKCGCSAQTAFATKTKILPERENEKRCAL